MEPTAMNKAVQEPFEVCPDMCEIVGIRHGLTDYNVERRLQGRLDIPMNDVGRRQCYECGLKLRSMFTRRGSLLIDAFFSSTLQRAQESAKIIKDACGYDGVIRLDERIIEWNAGILQGHLIDDIPRIFPDEWGAWTSKRAPDFAFAGGESFRCRFERVKSFMEEIAREFVGRRVVVVTHGGVLDDIYRLVRHIPLHLKTQASKENAAVHIVRGFPASHASGGGSVRSARKGSFGGVDSNVTENSLRIQGESSPELQSDISKSEVPYGYSSSIHWELVTWGNSPLTQQGELKLEPLEVNVRAPEYV